MIEAIDEIKIEALKQALPQPTHMTAKASDDVFLSETARATLLSQEGLSITQISDELGITAGVVLSELGISDN